MSHSARSLGRFRPLGFTTEFWEVWGEGFGSERLRSSGRFWGVGFEIQGIGLRASVCGF